MRRRLDRTLVLVSLLVVMGTVACGGQGSATSGPVDLSTPTVELAPSYEEIQQSINRIVKTPYPEGLPVGVDGVEDKALVTDVQDYSDSVEGRKVVNWRGWYLYHQVDRGKDANVYSIAILMQEPQPEVEYDPDLYLFIRYLVANADPNIESLSYGEPVMFSGVLMGVDYFGLVGVGEGMITSTKSSATEGKR